MTATINRSQIFKNAWNFVRTLALSISEALKQAWAEAKNGIGAMAVVAPAERYPEIDAHPLVIRQESSMSALARFSAEERETLLNVNKARAEAADNIVKVCADRGKGLVDDRTWADICYATYVAYKTAGEYLPAEGWLKAARRYSNI